MGAPLLSPGHSPLLIGAPLYCVVLILLLTAYHAMANAGSAESSEYRQGNREGPVKETVLSSNRAKRQYFEDPYYGSYYGW